MFLFCGVGTSTDFDTVLSSAIESVKVNIIHTAGSSVEDANQREYECFALFRVPEKAGDSIVSERFGGDSSNHEQFLTSCNESLSKKKLSQQWTIKGAHVGTSSRAFSNSSNDNSNDGSNSNSNGDDNAMSVFLIAVSKSENEEESEENEDSNVDHSEAIEAISRVKSLFVRSGRSISDIVKSIDSNGNNDLERYDKINTEIIVKNGVYPDLVVVTSSTTEDLSDVVESLSAERSISKSPVIGWANDSGNSSNSSGDYFASVTAIWLPFGAIECDAEPCFFTSPNTGKITKISRRNGGGEIEEISNIPAADFAMESIFGRNASAESTVNKPPINALKEASIALPAFKIVKVDEKSLDVRAIPLEIIDIDESRKTITVSSNHSRSGKNNNIFEEGDAISFGMALPEQAARISSQRTAAAIRSAQRRSDLPKASLAEAVSGVFVVNPIGFIDEAESIEDSVDNTAKATAALNGVIEGVSSGNDGVFDPSENGNKNSNNSDNKRGLSAVMVVAAAGGAAGCLASAPEEGRSLCPFELARGDGDDAGGNRSKNANDNTRRNNKSNKGGKKKKKGTREERRMRRQMREKRRRRRDRRRRRRNGEDVSSASSDDDGDSDSDDTSSESSSESSSSSGGSVSNSDSTSRSSGHRGGRRNNARASRSDSKKRSKAGASAAVNAASHLLSSRVLVIPPSSAVARIKEQRLQLEKEKNGKGNTGNSVWNNKAKGNSSSRGNGVHVVTAGSAEKSTSKAVDATVDALRRGLSSHGVHAAPQAIVVFYGEDHDAEVVQKAMRRYAPEAALIGDTVSGPTLSAGAFHAKHVKPCEKKPGEAGPKSPGTGVEPIPTLSALAIYDPNGTYFVSSASIDPSNNTVNIGVAAAEKILDAVTPESILENLRNNKANKNTNSSLTKLPEEFVTGPNPSQYGQIGAEQGLPAAHWAILPGRFENACLEGFRAVMTNVTRLPRAKGQGFTVAGGAGADVDLVALGLAEEVSMEDAAGVGGDSNSSKPSKKKGSSEQKKRCFAGDNTLGASMIVLSMYPSCSVKVGYGKGFHEPGVLAGKVTKATGRYIEEINEAPAGAVYSAWAGGEFAGEVVPVADLTGAGDGEDGGKPKPIVGPDGRVLSGPALEAYLQSKKHLGIGEGGPDKAKRVYKDRGAVFIRSRAHAIGIDLAARKRRNDAEGDAEGGDEDGVGAEDTDPSGQFTREVDLRLGHVLDIREIMVEVDVDVEVGDEVRLCTASDDVQEARVSAALRAHMAHPSIATSQVHGHILALNRTLPIAAAHKDIIKSGKVDSETYVDRSECDLSSLALAVNTPLGGSGNVLLGSTFCEACTGDAGSISHGSMSLAAMTFLSPVDGPTAPPMGHVAIATVRITYFEEILQEFGLAASIAKKMYPILMSAKISTTDGVSSTGSGGGTAGSARGSTSVGASLISSAKAAAASVGIVDGSSSRVACAPYSPLDGHRGVAVYEDLERSGIAVFAFRSAADAVEWGAAAQEALHFGEHKWPASLEKAYNEGLASQYLVSGPRVKIGVATGDPLFRFDGSTGAPCYYGECVEYASHIASLAFPGCVGMSFETASDENVLTAFTDEHPTVVKSERPVPVLSEAKQAEADRRAAAAEERGDFPPEARMVDFAPVTLSGRILIKKK